MVSARAQDALSAMRASSPALFPEFGSSFRRETLLAFARGYQAACVLAAAADLELFDAIGKTTRSASVLARKRKCKLRGMQMLLDALCALRLVRKDGDGYFLPKQVAKHLRKDGAQSVLGMVQHQSNCLRNWALLAESVKSGRPIIRRPSVRGFAADREAYIEGMHSAYAHQVDEVLQSLFINRSVSHILDVGGASGTWTAALLRKFPRSKATLVDLPQVIPMARRRLFALGLLDRVRLKPMDFYTHVLPCGADLAWVSAIVHQNSRAQNRGLFRRIYRAMAPRGYIAVRDVVMAEGRTTPLFGALFALNMLVETSGGGTFTFAELRADLKSAGFGGVSLVRTDHGMNAVIVATKGSG